MYDDENIIGDDYNENISDSEDGTAFVLRFELIAFLFVNFENLAAIKSISLKPNQYIDDDFSSDEFTL